MFASALFIAAASTAFSIAHASPWLAPGDISLRHDIQLLADAGVIRAPVTTWPMSWPDIAGDVLEAERAVDVPRAVGDALVRVRRLAHRASVPGFGDLRVSLAGAHEPIALRTFGDAPREEGEAEFGATWLGDRTVANLEVTWVSSPRDEKSVRLDGSYVGLTFANVMLSAGAMERWWGPGWEGSLILSNNARPIPGVTLERNYSARFRWKLLRWLGPWRASIVAGEGEDSDVAVPKTRFFAARFNFRPAAWLEVALSRTAQWCGDGRPCDLATFGDLLIGRDNPDDALLPDDQPGNQMAGYDLRLSSPWQALPVALYSQAIGEDEAGGLPSKFLGLFGVELWGANRLGSYRIHFEHADTACNFSRANPEFDCAYRNAVYPQGYTYRGRIVGHSLDGDGRMSSVAFLLVRSSGETWSVLARRVELNRGALVSEDLENAEVQYNRAFAWGRLELGAGYDRYDGPGSGGSGGRGFVRWQQGF